MFKLEVDHYPKCKIYFRASDTFLGLDNLEDRKLFYCMCSLIRINLLALYHECCSLIGYATHYIFYFI